MTTFCFFSIRRRPVSKIYRFHISRAEKYSFVFEEGGFVTTASEVVLDVCITFLTFNQIEWNKIPPFGGN